jgi:hypothetical protein
MLPTHLILAYVAMTPLAFVEWGLTYFCVSYFNPMPRFSTVTRLLGALVYIIITAGAIPLAQIYIYRGIGQVKKVDMFALAFIWIEILITMGIIFFILLRQRGSH